MRALRVSVYALLSSVFHFFASLTCAGWQVLNRPNREAVEPIVVVRGIDVRTIEVQVVAVSRRVQRGRPVVAVRASVVQTRPVPVARGGEENAPTKTAGVGYHLYDVSVESLLYIEAAGGLLFFPQAVA